MKCRYKQCKLGGEVARKDAIANGSMYYHPECYEKQQIKREIARLFNTNPIFTKRDTNIALGKAIDTIQYPPQYVLYVAKHKFKDLASPYNLLYQLKVEQNYIKFKEQLKIKYNVETNKGLKGRLQREKQPFKYKKPKDIDDIY